jgi:hypothetical protein
MKTAVAPDHVYLSFYGRFRIQMFKKKVCLRGKEPFNLPILGSLPSGGTFVPRRVANCQSKLKKSHKKSRF